MRGNQNMLERFRSIAKRLVDEHSAEVFVRKAVRAESGADEVYYHQLDDLGRQLNEQAEQFIGGYKTVSDDLKTEIWDTCRKYVEQFVKRNHPGLY